MGGSQLATLLLVHILESLNKKWFSRDTWLSLVKIIRKAFQTLDHRRPRPIVATFEHLKKKGARLKPRQGAEGHQIQHG